MYHHVGADKLSNSPAILEKHFQYIKDNFNVVLPGEALAENAANICLVFDDASYSFYSYAFPLIKRIGIRVVLAVSPKFIVDSADRIAPHVRLHVPVDEMMFGDTFSKSIPFCSWEELSEISSSGVVKIASHSYSHCNLLKSPKMETELTESKGILQEKLQKEVDTFVYPYGRFNAAIVKLVRKHYRFGFAVGAGDNRTWDGVGGVLFRMYADDLSNPTSIFSEWNLKKYRVQRYRLFIKKWFMDLTPSHN
jgi:peptidoglycan/xylan/chitin deacetylase (PgdA/CDA1 family)